MDILVAGGHGKVALRLLALLAGRGDTARGLIRNPEHAADLERIGAVPVLGDLENDQTLAPHVRGADAVVFAAGAGPGSGAARKRTVDLGGAVKLAAAAIETGVRRYVMVSSIGAQDPASAGDAMRPYLEAKAQADEYVRGTALDWTIVRPGSLTDDPGTGRVRVSTELGRRGPVPRDDVAAVLAAVLAMPSTTGVTFELFGGDVPITEALGALESPRDPR
ncbi:SDR family oxidoreductase [Actinoplanes sp. NPDC051633]|uniref:SDR family oxidoreductase n=1 Tax=Actinoplanes sp. NPDC051633 TaxID=3155670 RepID=UPI0034359D96